MRLPLLALRNQLVEKLARFDRLELTDTVAMPSAGADEIAQCLVVLALIFDDLVQDFHAALIAQISELASIFGDITALVELEAAQCHIGTADAVGQRVRLACLTAFVLRLWTAKLA